MDHSLTHQKPSLLMVSHCVPNAVGTPDRVRAWQLLKLATQTHTVCLICTKDGPVNLAQWRTVDRQVHHFVIGNTRPWHQKRSWWAGRIDKEKSETCIRSNAKTLGQLQGRPYDAILCTHPGLWPEIRTLEARQRICDLYPYRHTPRQLSNAQRIAAEVDLFILDRGGDWHGLADQACPTVVLPNRIDPGFFTHLHASQITRQYARPGLDLVLHGQWHRRHPNRVLTWFGRRVWPSIQQAVPQAQLRHTLPGHLDPLLTLSDASIVVCPETDPERARLSVLQAIAMQRPVIASRPAPEALGVAMQDGKHLLIGDREQDWIRHGIELLQSASARLRLSRNAGLWIKRYTPIEQAGQALIHALSSHVADGHGPINRAA